MSPVLFYIMGHDDQIEIFAHTPEDIVKSHDMSTDWFRSGPPPLEQWIALFRPITREDILNNATLHRTLEASLNGYGWTAPKMPDAIKDIIRPLLETKDS